MQREEKTQNTEITEPDLEEMNVPSGWEKAPARESKTKKRAPAVKKAAVKKATDPQAVATVVWLVVIGVVLLAALIGIGVVMSKRAGTISNKPSQSQSQAVSDGQDNKLPRDEKKSYFKNTSNKPELSSDGVKGSMNEAYYAQDGSLCVTMALSNGMDTAQRLSRLSLRILNAEKETIAEKTFDQFDPQVTIGAGDYGSVYLVFDSSYVKIKDDPLSTLTFTLEISTVKA